MGNGQIQPTDSTYLRQYNQYNQLGNYMPQAITSANDDIYMMGLQNKLYSANYDTSAYNGIYKNSYGQNFGKTQAGQTQGGSLAWPIISTLGVAGLGFAGMNYANHRFNSPITEVDGEIKFNDNFMSHFAGEYAAVENGEALGKFYKKFGGDKMKAENVEKVLDDLKLLSTQDGFKEIAATADKNAALKEVLQKAQILDTDGNLLNNKNISDVQNLYNQMDMDFKQINVNNNFLKQSEMLERAKGLEDGWKACGKELKAKREFLIKNADVLGISRDDVKKLRFEEKLDTKALDEIYTKGSTGVESFKTDCAKRIENIKNSMHGLAETSWNKEAGFFPKKGELFKGASKEMNKGLNNALAKMRRSRSYWVAGIATALTAIIFATSRKNG